MSDRPTRVWLSRAELNEIAQMKLIPPVINAVKGAVELLGELESQVEALLRHCPDAECPVCAAIICPHKNPMHFHHDGCPSCAEEP